MQCPECQEFSANETRCNNCGYKFPVPEPVFVAPGKPKAAPVKEIATYDEGKKQSTAPTEPKEVKIYDEPGKGKKQCPQCLKYVGLRVSVCACLFDFSTVTKAEKAIPTYDEPGRGRKQCLSCSKYVGYSAAKCPCGNEFTVGVASASGEAKASAAAKPVNDAFFGEEWDKPRYRVNVRDMQAGQRLIYPFSRPPRLSPEERGYVVRNTGYAVDIQLENRFIKDCSPDCEVHGLRGAAFVLSKHQTESQQAAPRDTSKSTEE